MLPASCELCPRRCRANRQAGESGICGADDRLLIARAALHEWEEPLISVGAGSGTVFFSNCPLRCIFCQNSLIACGSHGTEIIPDRLSDVYFELRSIGAANINLVTPTHYLPQVLHSIDKAKEKGFDLPFICNTSGYETEDTIMALDGSMDVYLTDFKYWHDGESDAARRYSRCPDYFEIADRAVHAMVESAGRPQFDEWCWQGRLAPRITHGVVVRHLILPGRLDDSRRVMRYLWSEFGDDVLYSVMNQYTPISSFPQAPELEERVSDGDYNRLLDFMDEMGMDDYFWQEGAAAEKSFIPAFDNTGVLPS